MQEFFLLPKETSRCEYTEIAQGLVLHMGVIMIARKAKCSLLWQSA